MSEPVTPPQRPPQWTRQDVADTLAAGRADLVDAARQAGQLDDLMSGGQPRPGDAMPSRPMDAREAADTERLMERVRRDAQARALTLPDHLVPNQENNR